MINEFSGLINFLFFPTNQPKKNRTYKQEGWIKMRTP